MPARALILCATVSLAAVTPALAQPASAPAQNAQVLEEVVVTATRREENLQNVPVAVTAVTAATLAERQITNISGLDRLAPSLTTAPFGDSTSPLIAIRGLVAQDIIMVVDPAVGVYLDGVYLGRATGANLNLYDVNRVEVLRGPQGTLFGRNTIGGAISITPNHPVHRFEAEAHGEVGSYRRWEIGGMVNVPVNDQVAFRLAVNHMQHDGYATSALTGAQLNAENIDYVRPSLSVDFADKWNLLLAGDYTRSKNNGQWINLTKTFPIADTLARIVSGGTQTASQFVDPFTTRPSNTTSGPFKTRNAGVSATLSGDLGFAQFKSFTAYREMRRSLNDFDQDGSPFEMLQLKYNNTKQHQFSQELQLFGKSFDNRLDWIVGVYYFSETGRDTVATHVLYPLSPNYSITDAKATNKNYAAYGQLTFAVTDQVSLIGGLRYAHDSRVATLFNRTSGATPDAVLSCVVAGATPPQCAVPLPTRKFHYWPFTLGVNYKPVDNALLYAKWTRGFRSGGYNVRGQSNLALQPYDPESVDSYEIGAKLDFLRRYRLNLAAFTSDYKDIQILTSLGSIGGAPIALTQNAGTARIKGFEAEAQAAFGPLRLAGGLSLLDPHYRSLRPGVVGLVQDSTFLFTPKSSWSASADYTIPAMFGSVDLHLDYSWRARTWMQPVPPNDPSLSQGPYALLNGAITAKVGDHVTASIFGRNLTDKHYFTRMNNIPSAGFLSGYPGDPRTYGMSIAYRY
jgi:iron complex outermembrane receptor protein